MIPLRRTARAVIFYKWFGFNQKETDNSESFTGASYAKVGIKRIEQAYARQQATAQFSYFIEPHTGHVLSDEMWRRIRDFFSQNL